MTRAALALALSLMPFAASAQDTQMPNFDVKAFCAKPDAGFTEASCADWQYTMRKLAVPIWLRASEAVRHECAQWSNYQTLGTCLLSHEQDRELQ